MERIEPKKKKQQNLKRFHIEIYYFNKTSLKYLVMIYLHVIISNRSKNIYEEEKQKNCCYTVKRTRD